MTLFDDAYLAADDIGCQEKIEIDFTTISPQGKSRWHECKEFTKRFGLHVFASNPHSDVNESDAPMKIELDALNAHPQIFVVHHQWSKIMANADPIKDEETRMPADQCVFEFAFSDLHICYYIESDEDNHIRHMAIARMPHGEWSGVMFNRFIDEESQNTFWLFWQEIKALCAVLDAEVAETEVIRAPKFINSKRVKKGRMPLNDYNIVKLSKRTRIANPHDGEPTGQRRRLHFRRGHWRHYHDHKTWIKWQLVGDASLGFVDKHYEA